jgi:hypothetical protein
MQLEGYVILGEDCSLRPKRKEQPQSKDPYQLTNPSPQREFSWRPNTQIAQVPQRSSYNRTDEANPHPPAITRLGPGPNP